MRWPCRFHVCVNFVCIGSTILGMVSLIGYPVGKHFLVEYGLYSCLQEKQGRLNTSV